jgi:hypothetical protein
MQNRQIEIVHYAIHGLNNVSGDYGIWLDDLRNPPTYIVEPFTWIVCRSMDEATQVVNQLGWPSFVSFDHDLGDQVPTGMDFARWLVNFDLDTNSMPQGWTYRVHTMNPVGKKNIIGLLENYMNTIGEWG